MSLRYQMAQSFNRQLLALLCCITLAGCANVSRKDPLTNQMTNELLTPLGPLFSPKFVFVNVSDDTGKPWHIKIYPDANNPLLKAHGLAMHYYYAPQRAALAKGLDSASDFAFGMTFYSGLMTECSCRFETTLSIPTQTIQRIVKKLQGLDFAKTNPSMGPFFQMEPRDPAPQLESVPVLENAVTVDLPPLQDTGRKYPFAFDTIGEDNGGTNATSNAKYQFWCDLNPATVTHAIESGKPPLSLSCNVAEQFYINPCQIEAHVDVDKVYAQFLRVLTDAGSLRIDRGSFDAIYKNCLISGAIITTIRENAVEVDPELKLMIDQHSEVLQQRIFDLLKAEIFDLTPASDLRTNIVHGFVLGYYGNFGVALKPNYQKRGIRFEDAFSLSSSIIVRDTVECDLTPLVAAIKTNRNKYFVTQTGNFALGNGDLFQKIYVVASSIISFNQGDPLQAAQIEVSYPVARPDGTVSLNADGTPTLKTLGDGFHYTPSSVNQAAPSTLARWTKDNPNDLISFAFMKLDKNLPDWDRDQVKITKKLIFNTDDPRVDLSTGTSEVTVVSTGNDHTPVVSDGEVGYIYVKFVFDRPIPPNVSLKLTVTLTGTKGNRTDVLTLDETNRSALWQVWSDKYFDADVAKVKIDVNVTPPPSNPLGAPVAWSGNLAVPLGLGRIKRIVPCIIHLPACPDPAQFALATQYIIQAQKDALTNK